MDPIFILILIGSVILLVILNYLDHVIRNYKDKGLREKLAQFLKSPDLTRRNLQDAEVLIRDLNSFFPWIRKRAINNLVKNDPRGAKTIFTALDLPYYNSWVKGFVITQDEFSDVFFSLIVYIHPVLVSGLVAIGRSSIEKLKDGLQHPNINVRFSVIDALGKADNPTAAEFLIPILDSSDVDERISAIVALGELCAKSATERGADTLKDENPVVREKAILSLVKINDMRALPALDTARSDHTVIEIRNSQTLGNLAEWAFEEIRNSNSQ